ncbi:MAG: S8 family serine peptidase [Gammaproteobacteria bacterium]|nr:S8 family serine peptidase [Gammaproteobacteria bacterium]
MLKRALILLIVQIILIPVIVFANEQETIRESTILFKLNTNATPAELKKLNALVNPSTILEIKEIEGVAVYVVKFRNIKGFEKAFSKQLMNTGAVKFAEPDASIPHAFAPNDELYGLQWHHTTINSPTAWEHVTGTVGLNTVKVCVLDTGVDTDHPDLVDNLLPGHIVPTSANVVEDLFGHGTGTSGVIGAVGNNSIGVAGMAWDIDIIPVKISMDVDENGNSSSSAWISDMATGISWCADQGVKVTNLSYGGAQYSTISEAAQYLRDRGGLLFMSAGNDGTYNNITDYPDYTSFVVVGSTGKSDSISSFSETGPFVDIAAPGENIVTTYLNGEYVYYTGTSFSSPMTAGLAALIYSINPDFTPVEVENYLFNTAADLGVPGDDDVYGHGRIDAGSAVVSAMDFLSPNIPPDAQASVVDITGVYAPLIVTFDGSNSTDNDGEIVSYIWDFGDGNTASGITATHTYTVDGTFNATLTVTDNRAAQTTSEPITIQVDPDPGIILIDPPSNLTASVDTNSVNLVWTHNLINITGFEIYRAQKIRGKYNYTSIVQDTGLVSKYVDGNLDLGDYRYKVRAMRVDANGDTFYSEFSNEVSVKVETTVTEPEPGTISAPVLSVSSDNLPIINLTWTHECPTDATCIYFIEKGNAKVRGQINFTALADGTGLSYPDTELSSGTYYYKVYATTESDTSDDSNIVSVRLK